jgi:hypothetical protein
MGGFMLEKDSEGVFFMVKGGNHDGCYLKIIQNPIGGETGRGEIMDWKCGVVIPDIDVTADMIGEPVRVSDIAIQTTSHFLHVIAQIQQVGQQFCDNSNEVKELLVMACRLAKFGEFLPQQIIV